MLPRGRRPMSAYGRHCPDRVLASLRGDQEFDIAVRPGDGAFNDARHAPARLRGEPIGDPLAGVVAQRRVTDDAALADVLAPDAELRLDQCPLSRRRLCPGY